MKWQECCRIHPLIQSLILSVLGTVPALVVLVLLFHNPACSFRGFSLFVAFSVLCACVSILLAQYRLMTHKTQSEDAESGGDAGETSVTTDAPPKYDTVVGKPPPYSHLYTSAEACYLPVYHTPQHTDGDTTLTSEEEETTRDTDPPPYSEVSKTIAPV
ncbi:uncharacterized protein [Cherax quadricarinatus]